LRGTSPCLLTRLSTNSTCPADEYKPDSFASDPVDRSTRGRMPHSARTLRAVR
jgi:hypothetical protein